MRLQASRNISTNNGYRRDGLVRDGYFCEWGVVVGDRIRRLRLQRGLSLIEVARDIRKPGRAGGYSAGYVSRLERGRTHAALHVYIQIADILEVDAGILLGPDQAILDVSDAERTLILCFRQLGLAPQDVLTTMVAAKLEPRETPPDPLAELASALRTLIAPVPDE